MVFAQTKRSTITSYLPRPEELGAWFLVDSAHVYIGEDLFALIDGGADLYLEYGFQQVVAAEYRNDQNRSIKLEIYEMSDPEAAYGRYSLVVGSQGKKVQIGSEGLLNEYYLVFWKNRFLVFISNNDTTSETFTEILTLATIVDRNIGESGNKPALLNDLPEKRLTTTKFVRGIIGLSSIYTFDTKNIFRVKEGIIGSYPMYSIFIFQYNSEKDAKESYNNAKEALVVNKRFYDFKTSSEYCTMTDQKGSRLCTAQCKDLIIIIITGQKSDAVAVCENVIASIRKTNDNRNLK